MGTILAVPHGLVFVSLGKGVNRVFRTGRKSERFRHVKGPRVAPGTYGYVRFTTNCHVSPDITAGTVGRNENRRVIVVHQ